CRFSALYFIPFCGGLAAAGSLRVGDALLGAAFWCVLTVAIEITNRLTDRVEDEINRPERTDLCAQVGWERLARLETLAWGTVAASAVVWLVLAPSVLLAGLIALGVAAGVGYSRGPRLSRQRVLVLVMLSGAFVGPFALGWATGSGQAGADWRQLGQFVPLFWVLTLFIASLAGIKDITDRDGDEAIGYRSAFVAFAERHGTLALAAVAAVPYAALAAFVAAGALPTRMLALVGLLPVSIAVGLAVRGAGTSVRDRLTVREALYAHWLAFTSLALLTCYPSASLLAAIVAAWLYWLLASRLAHWGDPLRLRDLGGVARLARLGWASPIAPRAAPATNGRAWGSS
ncbi:MAG TPA: UbiA family prenyltransferase, partial [Conexibacter sp.]|nr:UbiA family prenyltransferase [Conexibacter sp.]